MAVCARCPQQLNNVTFSAACQRPTVVTASPTSFPRELLSIMSSEFCSDLPSAVWDGQSQKPLPASSPHSPSASLPPLLWGRTHGCRRGRPAPTGNVDCEPRKADGEASSLPGQSQQARRPSWQEEGEGKAAAEVTWAASVP